ncbi:hypothetical protein MMPV_009558 [Pyropia vietnamensis]
MGRSPVSSVGAVATAAAAVVAVIFAVGAVPRVAANADAFSTLASTYPLFHSAGITCSPTLTIRSGAALSVRDDGTGLLNASALALGDTTCSGGNLLFATWSAINNANNDSKTLVALRGLFGVARYTAVVSNLETGGDFWAGVLPTGVTCGTDAQSKLPASTALFLSSNSSKAISWGNPGTVPAGETQIAVILTTGDLCLFASRVQKATPAPAATPTPTPTPLTQPTASPTATPDDDDDEPACFPAAATVERADGSIVRMDALRVGDVVRVAPGVGASSFSPVYLFTHADATRRHGTPHVRLTTASGAAITSSAGHYVYASGRLVAASAVDVGDTLQVVRPGGGDGQWVVSPVTAVTAVPVAGLYNPQTLAGEVVVDGVRASTYTTAIAPRVAAALLAPLRAAWSVVGAAAAPPAVVVSALDAPGRWVVAHLARILGGGVSAEL